MDCQRPTSRADDSCHGPQSSVDCCSRLLLEVETENMYTHVAGLLINDPLETCRAVASELNALCMKLLNHETCRRTFAAVALEGLTIAHEAIELRAEIEHGYHDEDWTSLHLLLSDLWSKKMACLQRIQHAVLIEKSPSDQDQEAVGGQDAQPTCYQEYALDINRADKIPNRASWTIQASATILYNMSCARAATNDAATSRTLLQLAYNSTSLIDDGYDSIKLRTEILHKLLADANSTGGHGGDSRIVHQVRLLLIELEMRLLIKHPSGAGVA